MPFASPPFTSASRRSIMNLLLTIMKVRWASALSATWRWTDGLVAAAVGAGVGLLRPSGESPEPQYRFCEVETDAVI